MSRANVELLHAFVAAYNARDIAAATGLCTADVTVHPDVSVFPEAASLIGRERFRGFLEEIWSAWDSGGYTTAEVIEVGDGRLLVRGDWGGRGMSSGLETYTNLSAIYTFRDGRISGAKYFFDHDRARTAAGLPA